MCVIVTMAVLLSTKVTISPYNFIIYIFDCSTLSSSVRDLISVVILSDNSQHAQSTHYSCYSHPSHDNHVISTVLQYW